MWSNADLSRVHGPGPNSQERAELGSTVVVSAGFQLIAKTVDHCPVKEHRQIRMMEMSAKVDEEGKYQ